MTTPRLAFTLVFSCVALLGLACAEDEPETYDPAEILAEALDFEQNFERLDRDGLVTMHDPNMTVRAQFWANDIGAEVFRSIDVDDPTQMVEVPRGAIFLKENYDVDGNPLDFIQVIAKFEEGYNPPGRDYYFALIRRDGSVMMEGKIESCRDCHDQNAPNTDYIIGLPAAELAP